MRSARAVLDQETDVRDILRALAGIAAPFVLIFAGAGLAGLAMTWELVWLFWAGLIVAGIGVLWIAAWVMLHE